jgi:glucosamine-6-phosphate deaminase
VVQIRPRGVPPITVFGDSTELALNGASWLWDEVSSTSNPRVLLATGRTPVLLYEHMAIRAETEESPWKKAHAFALDEYVGLDPEDPRTFRAQLWRWVGKPLGMSPETLMAPDGQAVDPESEARRYEELLQGRGQIHIAVLGVGINGHLAFNEPGTPWSSTSHVSTLSRETRAANSADFGGDIDAVPKTAITVGIKTILRARKILLLAQGIAKRNAISALQKGVLDSAWPVTSLLTHPDVRVLVDQEVVS